MTTANDLIVVFLALEMLSIPLYVLAAFDRRRLALAGSGHQVLRARRVLVGDLPLRRRARLRRDRHHVAHRDRRRSSRRTRCSSRARCSPGSRCCSSGSASRSRRCRSTCGRPTCTRARPRRSPRSWPSATKAAGVRRAAAGLRWSRSRCTATDWRPVVWALAVLTLARRQHRRRACRPTSSACSRTRRSRTPATCSSAFEAGDRPRAAKPRSSTSSSTRSWSIGSFAVVTVLSTPRRRRPLDRRATAASALRRPVLGGLLVLLPARAGRHPAHRRLHRQARGVLGRGRRAASTRSSSSARSPPSSPRSPTCGSRSRSRRRRPTSDGERRAGPRPSGRRRHVDRARRHRGRDARARHRARRSSSTGPGDADRPRCTSSTWFRDVDRSADARRRGATRGGGAGAAPALGRVGVVEGLRRRGAWAVVHELPRRRRSRRARGRRPAPAAATTSTLSGTLRSSSSKRCLRLIANARTATSIGERSGRSMRSPATFEHVDPVDRARPARATAARCRRPRRRPGCGRRGGSAGRCPGSAALASSAGSSGPRGEHDLVAGVEVGGDHPQRHRRAPRRSSGVSPRRKSARRPSLEKRWSSRVRRFQARRQPPAGEDLVAAERLPGLLEPLDPARGSASAAITAPLNAPAERPDDDVGDDVALEERAQHARPARPPGCRRRRARTRCATRAPRRCRSWLIGRWHRAVGCPLPCGPFSVVRVVTVCRPRKSRSYAAPAIQPPTPTPHSSEGAGGPRVSEFYRNYLAVAVFIGAALLMVGAMLGVGRLLRPPRPRRREAHALRGGLRSRPRLRPVERPLLRVRAALRDVRRRGRVHLPVGGATSRASACFGLIEMIVFIVILTLGLVYAWRKGVLRWA